MSEHKSTGSTADRYAVFGNPVAHSKSPYIHAMFAAQTGELLIYDKQLVEADGFEQATAGFFRAGGKGLNITLPFKLDACCYASQLTPRARRAGAVNTLALQSDGTVLGDNTDGIGMVSDMVDNLGWTLAGKRVLILGAGGAVRGILQPLFECRPEQVIIANRTVAKALQLTRDFRDLGKVRACGFEDLAGRTFDLVINGTAASLAGDLPPLPEGLLNADACCYDMMYGAEPTIFMRWAADRDCANIADGLGMLVGQAAESFFIWRGIRPAVKPVIEQLREEMGTTQMDTDKHG